MAKQFVDLSATTELQSVTKQDGTALTLTNGVRVLYDDTLPTATLALCLEKAKLSILKFEQ